uniref:Spermatogenesis-associated protein 31D1-like n=1 Tax=Tursiops truncatus TaxID=9739 RepID=A0A6J3RKJ2_TURTR|nr:spermatogenesis-associated protein 31D1-like [Tursiops truncatus]
MGFREWNVLSFLNSVIDPYLSCDSTSLDIYRNLIVLCELVLLLLLLWYLVSLPFSPTFSKTKDIRKRQGRAKRRRKGGTPKGKVLPIPAELSKGDPSCLFHDIQGP